MNKKTELCGQVLVGLASPESADDIGAFGLVQLTCFTSAHAPLPAA